MLGIGRDRIRGVRFPLALPGFALFHKGFRLFHLRFCQISAKTPTELRQHTLKGGANLSVANGPNV